MRLPATGGAGVVPETSLEHHRARGWLRCSDAIPDSDKDQVRLGDYTVDLDAEPDTSDEPAESAPAETSKEK